MTQYTRPDISAPMPANDNVYSVASAPDYRNTPATRTASATGGQPAGSTIERVPAPAGSFPRIYCDLPQSLPVLSQEIDLIQTYMADLIATIAANDNKP